MKKLTVALAFILILSNLVFLFSCTDNGESETDDTTTTETEGELEMILTPEKMGISSADITKMLEGYKKEGLSMHSMLVMRHGEIIAEAYAEPFDENSLHRMYSTSKSFVSIAIGVLEAENIHRGYDRYVFSGLCK